MSVAIDVIIPVSPGVLKEEIAATVRSVHDSLPEARILRVEYVKNCPISIVPGSDEWAELAIKDGIERGDSPFILVIEPGMVIAPKDHVANRTAFNYMPPNPFTARREEVTVTPYDRGIIMDADKTLDETLSTLDSEITSLLVPTFEVEDNIFVAHLARGIFRYCAILRRGTEFTWSRFGFRAGTGTMGMLTKVAFLSRPRSALLFELERYKEARNAAVNTRPSGIDRRIFIKARAKVESDQALMALRTLFTHCSLSEELCPLIGIMENLPYTLEERPEVEELRKLLDTQIGHLKGGEEKWYATGSPSEVMNAAILRVPDRLVVDRVLWLIEQARRFGLQRIIELGSVDGINQFDLVRLAPEITWEGMEVNPKAIEHAEKIAKELNTEVTIHNAPSFRDFSNRVGLWTDDNCDPIEPYDGVAVFEVLEHNFVPSAVLDAAERCLKPGGKVFITTPCGNWSAHDESTRVLALRKDHVRAFTVKRMQRLIETRCAKDIEVFERENPNYEEGNSWVYASYTYTG